MLKGREYKRLARAIDGTDCYKVLESGDIAGTDGRIYGRICGNIVQFYNDRGVCPIYTVHEVLAVYYDPEDDYRDIAGFVHNDGRPFTVVLATFPDARRWSRKSHWFYERCFKGRWPASV